MDTSHRAAPSDATPHPPVDLTEVGRVSQWCAERLLWDGEDAADVLAAESWRGHAYRDALQEIEDGADRPSAQWRGRYGFALGLLRLSARDPIHLADGTILGEHQAEVVEAVLTHIADEVVVSNPGPADDPGRNQRLWFEHATGTGKTVAAAALVDGHSTGGVLILTHRKTLVDQFHRELEQRGYGERIFESDDPMLDYRPNPVVIETYAWFARNFDQVSEDTFQLIICDEVHQSLGDRTSNAIKAFEQSHIIGMTATGRLLAKDVSDLFPFKVSQFDLRQATQLGVIAPLRVLRVPPGVTVGTLEGVRMRSGDFDADQLQDLLNHQQINYACAQFYRNMFDGRSGVVYAAGVDHAERLAIAFIQAGVPAAAVSGVTPAAELQRVLDDFDAGKLLVVVNAQLLVEGWNSPRVEVCLHLAPTASPRVYQQRVGRVTRRSPGKEAGIVVDFVPADYRHDQPVVTLHSLLGHDLYRTGDLVTTSPLIEGQAAQLPVSTTDCLPVAAEPKARRQALEQHTDLIDVDRLDDVEQMMWATIAGRTAADKHMFARRQNKLKAAKDTLDVNRSAMCRAALLENSDVSVRQAAADLLISLRREESLLALADVTVETDDAALARSLVWKVIGQAAQGTPLDFGKLIAVARTERAAYDTIARRDRSYRDLMQHTGGDGAAVRLASMAITAPPQAAAAFVVCMPQSSPWAQRRCEEVASERFTSPQQFAHALMMARSPQGTSNSKLVFSR